MSGFSPNNWTTIERALGELTAPGQVEVREDGEWLAEFAAFQCEVLHEGKIPLLHLWSDERNLTRRILRVIEQSQDCIALQVQRFGRAKPGCLEFVRVDSRRSPGRITREQFRARFRRVLAERFPDATVDSLTAARDLEHSFSGLYVRGRMHEGERRWALLAVSPSEDAAAIDGMLTFGILWLDATRSRAERQAVQGLRLFVPEGMGRILCERLAALSSSARTEIFEFSEPDGAMRKLDPADAGNLESWLAPRRDAEAALAAGRDSIERIRNLAPGTSEIIQPRVPPGTSEVALCFRGLEFARWSARDGALFGLGDARERLSEATEPALEKLIRDLDLRRSSLAENTNHPLYRAAPERWLETLALENPTALDAQLAPGHLYSQVPALTTRDRGVLDLLGVTRRGRLVVIELKASEDIHMPVQAVDYWLRVRRHQREGDFQRYGYFAGMELSSDPPLVWLVAPGLRFHSATDTVLKYLSSEISVTRIGLNENWRRGLKVLFRQ